MREHTVQAFPLPKQNIDTVGDLGTKVSRFFSWP